MIIDTIGNAKLYYGCHPLFEQAFEFLRSAGNGDDLSARTEIDGTNLYVLKVSGAGKGKDKTALEAHRKYIDIQYSAMGKDIIGWKPIAEGDAGRGYDPEKDIEFYDQQPEQWLDVREGVFAIFFPGDAHAPMATLEQITKLVVKVLVSR
ncbi:MAG: YhcH/YjgK/YiaL family protein [Bryobacteraceae bacterium]